MALSYRMLNIAGAPAGLLGLEELFQELFDQDIRLEDASLDSRLLEGVRKHNYVPKSAITHYQQALRAAYGDYYRQKQGGKAVVARAYGTWRGYPREHIPWFPTISEALCTQCGACRDICARPVFDWDENGKIWVAEPFLCLVGCCFCKSVCEPKALFFPGQELLKNYPEKM